jgi:UDP-N-acetylmuramyl tripeptide synthase
VRLEPVAAAIGIFVVDKSQQIAKPCENDQSSTTVLTRQVRLDKALEQLEKKLAGRASQENAAAAAAKLNAFGISPQLYLVL